MQDVFVFSHLNYKDDGFFVEFGATDGLKLSNTYLLEKKYGWRGILAEPGKTWHANLRKNRSCVIDTRCVWSESGQKITFYENKVGELSGVVNQSNPAKTAIRRATKKNYNVETVSLLDLLIQHKAPSRITYLSIDTEGSEINIIENFDFKAYRPMIISIEHNYSIHEKSMIAMLENHDYVQIFSEISEWDAWFVDKKNTELNQYFSCLDETI